METHDIVTNPFARKQFPVTMTKIPINAYSLTAEEIHIPQESQLSQCLKIIPNPSESFEWRKEKLLLLYNQCQNCYFAFAVKLCSVAPLHDGVSVDIFQIPFAEYNQFSIQSILSAMPNRTVLLKDLEMGLRNFECLERFNPTLRSKSLTSHDD